MAEPGMNIQQSTTRQAHQGRQSEAAGRPAAAGSWAKGYMGAIQDFLAGTLL